MNQALHKDALIKGGLRATWRSLQTGHVILSSATSGGPGNARVFYGGARGGNLGGPLVKVKRLREYFPEHRWKYNLVYILSNAPYLSGMALEWLRARRIPIVLNQNGVFYPGWYAGDWKKMNAVMARAYHRADHVFWQSAFCRRAADRFLGKREGPGELLFNAIDTRRFSPAGERPEGRPFTFLLTGRIEAHLAYRLENSIAGLRAARDAGLEARLVIAGHVAATALASSRQLAARLALKQHVDFLGPYTQENAPDIYRGADAYVMTKYLDPCPNTVLEAMASGLPILYSDSGGVPELVGPDAGVAMPVPEHWDSAGYPLTAETIGAGMINVATSARTMGKSARIRAEMQFEITRWIERHREVFQAQLEARR